MNGKMIFAGLVAVLMVACTVPFFASEETDALTGHGTHMSLNTDRVSLFMQDGQTSAQFTVTVDSYPAGKSVSDLKWKLNDLNDGNCVSFDAAGTTFTASGTNVVTVYAKSTGTVEVEVYIENYDTQALGYYDSAVIYVRNSPGTQATEYNFFFQIYDTTDQNRPEFAYHDDVSSYVGTNLINIAPTGYVYDPTDTSTTSTNNFAVGFWKNVTFAEMYAADSTFTLDQFTALAALQFLVEREAPNNGWGLYTSYGGWIDSFLGLSYEVPDSTTFIYWAQYHAVGNQWVFNNSTLDYVFNEDSCDIGLIFCASLSASYTPPFPATEP